MNYGEPSSNELEFEILPQTFVPTNLTRLDEVRTFAYMDGERAFESRAGRCPDSRSYFRFYDVQLGDSLSAVSAKFLPTGEVRIIGKRRDGMPVGNWWRVPSLHILKGDVPQPGYFVIVEANGQPSTGSYTEVGQHKNPKIEVTGGVYGGGNLDFEDNVTKMKVTA